MSTVPLVERRLADLSDLEIADLTQSLKAEQAGARPLVSAREPIAALLAEYEGAATYQAKVISLERDSGFVGIRRTRGDGGTFPAGLPSSDSDRLLLPGVRVRVLRAAASRKWLGWGSCCDEGAGSN